MHTTSLKSLRLGALRLHSPSGLTQVSVAPSSSCWSLSLLLLSFQVSKVLRVCSGSSGAPLSPLSRTSAPIPQLWVALAAKGFLLRTALSRQELLPLKMSGRLHSPLGSGPQPVTDQYRGQHLGLLASRGNNSGAIPSPGLLVDQVEARLQQRPHPC